MKFSEEVNSLLSTTRVKALQNFVSGWRRHLRPSVPSSKHRNSGEGCCQDHEKKVSLLGRSYGAQRGKKSKQNTLP